MEGSLHMKQRGTYLGRPNFPSDDRAAGDLGREHRLNVKTFSAVVLGDMPAAASSVRAAMSHEYRPAAARKAAAAPPERAPPREAQEAVAVEPTGRVARKLAPREISVGLHDGREWDFGLQPSEKRYVEKFAVS